MVYNPSKARPGGGGGAGGGGRGARNTAARKAAARKTKTAKRDLDAAKKSRVMEKEATAKVITRSTSSAKKRVKAQRDLGRRIGHKPSMTEKQGIRSVKALRSLRDPAKARRRADSKRGLDTQNSAKRVVEAKKALKGASGTERRVNRLTRLSTHIAKRAGGGRRTHFLDDAPK